MTIAYYPDGVTNISPFDPLGSLPYLDPRKWNVFMENFNVLPTTLGWTNTNTNGTLAVVSGIHGTGGATLTMGGALNDVAQLYMTTATFALIAGKQAFFEASFKVDKGAAGTIGAEIIFVGMAAVQTTTNFMIADGSAMTSDDCIGFFSAAGTVNTNTLTRKSDVESVNAAACTYTDAVYLTLTWHFDGTVLTYYKNGTLIGTLASGYTTAAVSPTIYIRASEAKAKVLTMEYLMFANQR